MKGEKGEVIIQKRQR